MNPRRLFAISLLLLLCPAASQSQVWNLYNDFSATQNPNGAWSFGWRPGADGPFNLYTDTSQFDLCTPDPDIHPWSYIWNPLSLQVSQNAGDQVYSCNGCDYPPACVWFHPGPDGQQSVVRWTAPSAMEITLNAHFLALDDGSSSVKVYHGDALLFSHVLPGYGAVTDCDLAISCQSGDVVDVAIDAISFYNDSVRLDLVIAGGPTPVGGTTWGLVKSGYR